MESVVSRDATKIAYQRRGTGPPLVLVHGTSGSHSSWAPVAPLLEEHVTMIAMDRRGRGESGDSDDYAIEREFEDVAAVVDAVGEPVALLGYSFGAICALEAAFLTKYVVKLILYEGPIRVPGGPTSPEGAISRLQVELEAGKSEEVLVSFLRDFPQLSEPAIEHMRNSPIWPNLLTTVPTLPRELLAIDAYPFDKQRLATMEIPTLMLRGSESFNGMDVSTETVSAVIPNSRIVILQGQGHIAVHTAPDLFAHEVLAFLQAPTEAVDA